ARPVAAPVGPMPAAGARPAVARAPAGAGIRHAAALRRPPVPGGWPASHAPECHAPTARGEACGRVRKAAPTGPRNRGWAHRPTGTALLYPRQTRADRARPARWPDRPWQPPYRTATMPARQARFAAAPYKGARRF